MQVRVPTQAKKILSCQFPARRILWTTKKITPKMKAMQGFLNWLSLANTGI